MIDPLKDATAEERVRERVDALTDVLEDVARTREAAHSAEPRGRRSRDRVWLAIVVTLFTATVAWHVLPRLAGPDPLPRAEQRAALGHMVFAAAQQIEVHRARTGRLPDDLASIGLDLSGLTYRRAGNNHFTLTAAADSVRVVYDSADEAPSQGRPDRVPR